MTTTTRSPIFARPSRHITQLTRPTLDLLLRNRLPLQELPLLDPALLNIHKEQQEQKAHAAQREQEVEGRGISILRLAGRIDDSGRHQRTDETGRLSDDTEKREEQELLAAGRDFRDHGLRVAVPGADEEAVEDLVEPDCLVISQQFAE